MSETVYHFIGLGGIGMSALARLLLQKGSRVKGSDVAQTALLEKLQMEGADVHVGHEAELVTSNDTIIYNSDIPADNPEMQKALALKRPLLHRSDLLHQLIGKQKPLLVTGTHGKTTTTALLSHTLVEALFEPSFVIGGRPGRDGVRPHSYSLFVRKWGVIRAGTLALERGARLLCGWGSGHDGLSCIAASVHLSRRLAQVPSKHG